MSGAVEAEEDGLAEVDVGELVRDGVEDDGAIIFLNMVEGLMDKHRGVEIEMSNRDARVVAVEDTDEASSKFGASNHDGNRGRFKVDAIRGFLERGNADEDVGKHMNIRGWVRGDGRIAILRLRYPFGVIDAKRGVAIGFEIFAKNTRFTIKVKKGWAFGDKEANFMTTEKTLGEFGVADGQG